MLARLSAFVIWALVAASAVFWALRLFVVAPAAPAYAQPVGDASVARGDLTRLLGAAPVKTAAVAPVAESSSRFRLLGIVAPTAGSANGARRGGNGVALIAVDGKMPKAFAVGSAIDGELMLKSVTLRTVSIAPSASGAPAITLELPPLAAAATGSLSAAPVGGAYVPPPTPVPAYAPPTVPGFVPPVVQQGGPLTPPPMSSPQGRPESNAPVQ
jgi:general secretion pathway protein C